MYKEGHLGLSLLIFSFLFIPFGVTFHTLIFIAFSVVFSTLPDLDQKWGIKHRAYTHNILYGILSGILIGFAFGYYLGFYFGLLMFLAVMGGVMSHLLGDIIAGQKINGKPWKIKPFRPFSDRSIGLGIFKASNKKVNKGFLIIGSIVFLVCMILGIV
ncbi:MAG: metal-dependent hydrolase [Thermoplasmatota archaeon]